MNRSISWIRFYELDQDFDLLSDIDRRLFLPCEMDVRVVLEWSSDKTDVELIVK